MEGAKEVFQAMFRLMKHSNLISEEEYIKLCESTNCCFSVQPFIDVVNEICKEGNNQ